MKKFDGFIFDIDGTLTSTNKLIFASFNHVAEKYLNKTLTDKEIISLFGPPEDVILQKWFGNNYEGARKDYYNFYAKKHNELAKIFPGIEKILKIIKYANLPVSIFTGKGRKTSEITLKKLGIFNYFNMIVTGDDVKNHKPSSEGIRMFLNKFNLAPSKVLMIGDAPSDIKAAREAGVKIATVVWDSYAKEKVLKMKSDYVFHSVEELKELVEQALTH